MPDTRMAVAALILLGVATFAGWMAHGAEVVTGVVTGDVSISSPLPADVGVVYCGNPMTPDARVCINQRVLCATVGPDGAVLRLWGKRPDGTCHSEDAK